MEYEQQRQGSIAAIQLYQEQRKRSIAASKLIAKKLYESLESEEKQMFMHIACFFNAKSRDMALKIWKASQWRTAEHAAQTLLDKCLVQVEHYEEEWRGKGESVFRMHDHLRDLGRQMADEALPRRLWRPEHLRSMRKKGFKKILEETNDRCYDKFVDSSLNSGIEYFIGNSNNCAGSGTSSTALLWLGVDQARSERIPSWIPLTQLHYFGAWGLQEMNSLQIMSFTRVRFSKLVISGEMCPSLKHLEIAITNEVIEVELKLVKTLEILLLDSCSNLKTISDLSSLTNLQELIIHGCDKLESIEGAQELKELKSLVIIQASPHSGVLNFFSGLKKLPSHYTVITAEAADEAVSRLNLRLFSDVIGGHAIAEIENGRDYRHKLDEIFASSNAIVVCAFHISAGRAYFLEDFSQQQQLSFYSQVERIVTIVHAGQRNLKVSRPGEAEILKGFMATLDKESKALTVFNVIINHLYLYLP